MLNRFAIALLALTLTSGAGAQEGLATSSTLRGRDTIQLAPSGGRTVGTPGNALPDRATQGVPDAGERAVERRNDAAMRICRTC